jgi:hypothetical protein
MHYKCAVAQWGCPHRHSSQYAMKSDEIDEPAQGSSVGTKCGEIDEAIGTLGMPKDARRRESTGLNIPPVDSALLE